MEALMGRIGEFHYAPGATPLDSDEIAGLIPQHMATQSQLNEWEQANILEAEKWINRQSFKLQDIVTIHFIKKLHQRMFDKTWRWAGLFRQTNKNIGVDWPIISTQLKKLMDDLNYQIKYKIYPMNELAVRFHHRLVATHPFINGNGRHARLMTDIVLLSQKQPRFSWGKTKDLMNATPIRKQYIEALRAADKMNYDLLLEFVRE